MVYRSRAHINTGYSKQLGDLYGDQGKLVKGERMYQRPLQGKEEILGPEHILILGTANLGNLYRNQGKRDEVEKMYQRALQGSEKAPRPEHKSTLVTVNNLVSLPDDRTGEMQTAHHWRDQ